MRQIYYTFLTLILPFVSQAQTVMLSDEELLNTVEKTSFQYFWDGAEPNSGLARERINIDGIYPEHDFDVVTIGGSGFGIMALIAGVDRHYVTKKEGLARFEKIIDFLETADRFHGAWPHWLNGKTGKVKPFGQKDNGGDLVETSFLLQGLLSLRQYLSKGQTSQEQNLVNRINKLWQSVDFNWYRKDGQNVLYWHWSPTYQWEMNFPVHGFNECLIMYVLGASSPTHSIPYDVYQDGWQQKGKIYETTQYKGDSLHWLMQGHPPQGGPLFWAHYSFLGLNPLVLKENGLSYKKELTNLSKINYQWCVDNPLKFKGYSANSWGLTASYSAIDGYAAHAPNMADDKGTISPTAAISSIVYTPTESIEAIRNWYANKQDKIWGKYGFYDAFSDQYNWYPKQYLAIDQGPEVVMIENYRSQLLWNLFMSCPEIKNGLKKLKIKY